LNYQVIASLLSKALKMQNKNFLQQKSCDSFCHRSFLKYNSKFKQKDLYKYLFLRKDAWAQHLFHPCKRMPNIAPLALVVGLKQSLVIE
jgi:hypothetical protein